MALGYDEGSVIIKEGVARSYIGAGLDFRGFYSVHVNFCLCACIFLCNLAHFKGKFQVVHATQNAKIKHCMG